MRSSDGDLAGLAPACGLAPASGPVLVAAEPAARAGPYSGWPKRAFDLTLILLALPAVLPLVAVLALIVMLDGGRPFYTQARLGRGGRVFSICKLRTMMEGADGRLAVHLGGDPVARAEWDRTQKLRRDPRVTPFGRLLRRSSLDELPQLWNVAKGDMSLVGPRPMMPSQRRLYPGTAYFHLRPGITGPWQVSERNATSFAQRASFDGDYLDRLSFGRDLALLWATVRAVLRGTGY